MTLHASEPQVKRWTREEFYELAEEGYFRHNRVQLIEGEIIEMAPQGHAHAKALTYLTHWAIGVFPGFLVRIQMPLNATADSDPEPDLAVVPGPAQGYTDHPESAVLVVEVSDSSLRLDRRKAKIYATAGVAEFWLVSLQDRHVEIHRRPVPTEGRYEETAVQKPPQTVAPDGRPRAELSLNELFA